MKKIILLLVVFLAITHIVRADQGTCGTNCSYELDNKGFMLIKPFNASEKAYIQDKAFEERKDFTKVKIEDGIVSIGDHAFSETNLVKIDLPNSLESIGEYAFYRTELKKIDLPNSVTSIGEGAFIGAKLKKIKIPDSVTRIGARAFANNELREVILPKNLKVIEGGVFNDNDELVDIVIPDTVTSIECEDWYIASGAFESCEKLENVYFSKTLEHIGREAFSRTNIKELNLPKSLKTIGWYAFSEIKISELDIPDSVVFIDEGAFEETSLSYLIISDTTEVSDKAFKDAKIGTVYCRGDLDVCKENLENAVPETTVFKSISELNNGAADEQVDNVSSKETVEPKENIELQYDNEIVDDVDDTVAYNTPTSETVEHAETDDVVLDNTSIAETVDKNILADEELMKTITPEQLEEYIARGADVNARDESGWTIISIAAKNTNNPEIIEILLKQGVDVNDKNEYGMTALMVAAQNNENPEIVEVLLKYGANINEKDDEGDESGTALMYAAGCNDNPEVVEILLKNGADVNVKNEDGSTALTEAFGKSNKMFNVAKGWRGQSKPNQKQLNDKIIELLIENGADTDILHSKFISLENAVVIDFDPHGVFLKTQDIDRLILYTMDTNYSNNELFKNKGFMYQKIRNYTYTTIHGGQYSVPAYQATPYKFSDIDKFKTKVGNINKDKTVNSVNSYSKSTVKAVDKNILIDKELMKTITPEQLDEYIARGADVNAKDELGITPLMYATQNNQNPEIIETLLKYKADVNARDGFVGYTPLMIAAENNPNQKVIEILLKYGADMGVRGVEGKTPLMFAIRKNPNPKVIQTLLEHGASVNTRDEYGQTPLILAAGVNSNPEVIDILLKYNADIEAVNNGATPLIFACANNPNPKVIQTLINHGAIIPRGNLLLMALDANKNIEKNRDYWNLRDRIYNASNR